MTRALTGRAPDTALDNNNKNNVQRIFMMCLAYLPCVCLDSTLVSYLSFAYLQSRGVLSEALRPVSRGGDCVLQSSSHLALHGAPAGYIAKLESRMIVSSFDELRGS